MKQLLVVLSFALATAMVSVPAMAQQIVFPVTEAGKNACLAARVEYTPEKQNPAPLELGEVLIPNLNGGCIDMDLPHSMGKGLVFVTGPLVARKNGLKYWYCTNKVRGFYPEPAIQQAGPVGPQGPPGQPGQPGPQGSPGETTTIIREESPQCMGCQEYVPMAFIGEIAIIGEFEYKWTGGGYYHISRENGHNFVYHGGGGGPPISCPNGCQPPGGHTNPQTGTGTGGTTGGGNSGNGNTSGAYAKTASGSRNGGASQAKAATTNNSRQVSNGATSRQTTTTRSYSGGTRGGSRQTSGSYSGGARVGGFSGGGGHSGGFSGGGHAGGFSGGGGHAGGHGGGGHR